MTQLFRVPFVFSVTQFLLPSLKQNSKFAAENGWLEDDSFPFGVSISAYFQGNNLPVRILYRCIFSPVVYTPEVWQLAPEVLMVGRLFSLNGMADFQG